MALRFLAEIFGSEKTQAASDLERVVRAQVKGAEEDTLRLIVAAAGLLGTVAYADRDYSEAEERRIRVELARIPKLGEGAVDAVCAVLREHIVTIATVEAPIYARTLRDFTSREQRVEVLDILLDLAAADQEITSMETNLLRQTVAALGLTQDDYNASQARHRDKLAVLKSR